MKLSEAIEVLRKFKDWVYLPLYSDPNSVKEAIDTVVSALEKPTITERDMHINMQYYMEYCQMKGYVTPMEWIEKHKHF